MRFIKLKLYPIEALQASFEFMQVKWISICNNLCCSEQRCFKSKVFVLAIDNKYMANYSRSSENSSWTPKKKKRVTHTQAW